MRRWMEVKEMIKVEAGQQIYANVEKEQSPSGRGGFQTIFYTHSMLTESEVEEVEARMIYFACESEHIKRVFFLTSTGKCVAGQVVPLPEPDRLGRRGRYIAHAIILKREDFARLQGNPFSIFRNFRFITTVDEALKQGDFETGDIDCVPLEVHEGAEQSVKVLSGWDRNELKALALLALRAKQMAQERTAVAVVGEPEQVENALEASILAVPTALRQYCTFDTYFHRCNLVATYYWSVGLLERPSNPNLIVVDARSRRVVSEVEMSSQNTYERWVIAMLDAYDLNAVSDCKDFAFALAEWLDGREHDKSLLDSAPPETIESVFKVSSQQVRARLLTRICEHLPSVLARRVLEPIYRQMRALELFKRLREGFAISQLLDALNEVYASDGYRCPVRSEVQALGDLLQRAEHHWLRLVHACWTGQWENLRRMLEVMTDADYRKFVRTALHCNLIAPLRLIVPNKGDAFLEVYLAGATSQPDWVSLVKALLDINEVGCLARLAGHIAKWSPEDVRRIEKLLSGRTDLPESFQRAFNEALKGIPPAKGSANWLSRLFRRPEKGDFKGH